MCLQPTGEATMLADIFGLSTTDFVALTTNVVLLILTVFLAYLTWVNVREARELIEFETEPRLDIDAKVTRSGSTGTGSPDDLDAPGFYDEIYYFLTLSLKNRGGGSARDIKFAEVKNDFPIYPQDTRMRRIYHQDTNVVLSTDDGTKTPLLFSQTDVYNRGILELGPDRTVLLTWTYLPLLNPDPFSPAVVLKDSRYYPTYEADKDADHRRFPMQPPPPEIVFEYKKRTGEVTRASNVIDFATLVIEADTET